MSQNALHNARVAAKATTERSASPILKAVPILKKSLSMTDLKKIKTPTKKVVLKTRAATTGKKLSLMRKRRGAAIAKKLTYDFEKLRRMSPIPPIKKSPALSPKVRMTPVKTASGSPVPKDSASPYRKRPIEQADEAGAVGPDAYFSTIIMERLERKPYYGFGGEEGTITTLSANDLVYLAGKLENDLSTLIRSYNMKLMEVEVAKMKVDGLKGYISLAKLPDVGLPERLVPSQDADLIGRARQTERELEQLRARHATLENEFRTVSFNIAELELINKDAQDQSAYLRQQLEAGTRGDDQAKTRIHALEMLLAIEKDSANAARMKLETCEEQVERLSQAVVNAEETSKELKAVLKRHEKK